MTAWSVLALVLAYVGVILAYAAGLFALAALAVGCRALVIRILRDVVDSIDDGEKRGCS